MKHSRESRTVLHCVASGGMYGIERTLLNLLPALERLGWRVELACITDAETPAAPKANPFSGRALGDAYRASGGVVHMVEMRGQASVPGMWRLDSVLRGSAPTLVHTHGYKATILLGLLAWLRRIPAVTTYHGEAKKSIGLERHVAIETHFLRRFRGAVAVSDAIREELIERGMPSKSVRVIANGVPDRGRPVFPAVSSSRVAGPTLFTAARLVPGKNLHLIIEVVARLQGTFPGIRLRIAGDGPSRADLEHTAERLGVRNRIDFLGFIDDVAGKMTESDCFVLPSQTEGMPIALLEAMSVGCPVIASAVGAIPDLSEHGRNLVLVAPDDLDGLTEAVARLVGDRAAATQLAKNARDRFEREHSIEIIAQRYADFYTTMLGARGASVG